MKKIWIIMSLIIYITYSSAVANTLPVITSADFGGKINFNMLNEEMISDLSLTGDFNFTCAIGRVNLLPSFMYEDEVVSEAGAKLLLKDKNTEMARIRFSLSWGSLIKDYTQQTDYGSFQIQQTFESSESFVLKHIDVIIYGADICIHYDRSNRAFVPNKSNVIDFLRLHSSP